MLYFNQYGLWFDVYSEEKFVKIPKKIKNPTPFLNCFVTIHPGTTLRDIMNYVSQHEKLMDFIEDYSGSDIRAWNQELDRIEHDENHDDEKIQSLKLSGDYRVIDIMLRPEGDPSIGRKSLAFDPTIFGIGIANKENVEKSNGHYKEGDEIEYSISLGPLNMICDLPIFIKNEVSVLDERSSKDLAEYHNKAIFTLWKDYTLLELLSGIYREISFYGRSPQEVNEIVESLKKQREELENGTAKSYSLDEVKEHCEERVSETLKLGACPHCGDWKKRRRTEFNYRNETGDIICNNCDSVIDSV